MLTVCHFRSEENSFHGVVWECEKMKLCVRVIMEILSQKHFSFLSVLSIETLIKGPRQKFVTAGQRKTVFRVLYGNVKK